MLRTEDLIGKTALITGGSKGIGKAIAMLLAGAGCSVAIASRNLDEVSEVARQIREQGEYLKQVKDQVLKRIPVGRLGTTEDLEGVVLLLSTRASDFITGQTFFIDGGGTAF
jgi:NAD(P)-dependent dehydrogenase (short-subunit alcohol dehydrogenase family)